MQKNNWRFWFPIDFEDYLSKWQNCITLVEHCLWWLGKSTIEQADVHKQMEEKCTHIFGNTTQYIHCTYKCTANTEILNWTQVIFCLNYPYHFIVSYHKVWIKLDLELIFDLQKYESDLCELIHFVILCWSCFPKRPTVNSSSSYKDVILGEL